MTSKTILILGGGVGGLVTANKLRRQLPSAHKIIIIDREAKHLHEPGCAVQTAVSQGDVHPECYNSYMQMRLGEQE